MPGLPPGPGSPVVDARLQAFDVSKIRQNWDFLEGALERLQEVTNCWLLIFIPASISFNI
jgi:hypothetical protein